MSPEQDLEFRPHHFLCTLGFEGKGYSEEFVRGFDAIAGRLRRQGSVGDEIRIRVTGTTDSICAPCPNRRGELCESQEKIRVLDEAHAEILGIRPGNVLTWGEAKRLLTTRMTDQAFESACEPCAWKTLGMCKAALQRLKEENEAPRQG